MMNMRRPFHHIQTPVVLFIALTMVLTACGGGQQTDGAEAPQAASDGRYTTANDKALADWAKAASDDELIQWFNGLRTETLPADYVAPDWIRDAGDQQNAQAGMDQHHGEMRQRMSGGDRAGVIRSDILAARQFIYDGKAMADLPRGAAAARVAAPNMTREEYEAKRKEDAGRERR